MKNFLLVLILGVAGLLLASPGWAQQRVQVGENEVVVFNEGMFREVITPEASLQSFSIRSQTAATPQQCGEVWLYIPHVAVCSQDSRPENYGEWVTIVTYINHSADRKESVTEYISTANYTLRVHTALANGATVDGGVGANVSLSSKSSVSTTLSCCRDTRFPECTSSGVRTGWARVRTTSSWSPLIEHCVADVLPEVVFQLRDQRGLARASVGLSAIQGDSRHLLSAFSNDMTALGLAIANPGSAVTVTLRIFSGGAGEIINGVRQPYLTTSFTLDRGHQVSGMLGDFFKNTPGWQGACWDCNLEITSTISGTNTPAPVAVLAIRADRATDGNSFLMSGVPVFPGRDQ